MGTLFNQPVRNSIQKDLDLFLEEALRLSKKHKIAIEAVIAAKHAIEIERQNDLMVYDGDSKDEQLEGFGKLIQEHNEKLQNIADQIDSLATAVTYKD